MDLRQLRYFMAIAHAGSLTAAARQLGIAQPALSQHVLALDDGPSGHLPPRLSLGFWLVWYSRGHNRFPVVHFDLFLAYGPLV